jgi:superfamily I DNA/RNA helicase
MEKPSNNPPNIKNLKFERNQYLNVIIKCPSKKKVIVAGPGTGKTYLFQQLLKGKTNTLTLTFITSLVEDLSLELYGISEVKTLHGFAYSRLKLDHGIKVFPKLSNIIKEDASLIINKDIEFDAIFNNLDDNNANLIFYKNRKDYYDKYYGYTDIIYTLVKYFEKDYANIPQYTQIVVDEFQDFNNLEVALIDLLSSKSPILIVGDDDQALYDFKDADPKYIRFKVNPTSNYTFFNLPYCSRCTKVVVDAFNDIIENAKHKGYLKDRVNKPFICYEDEEKQLDSNRNSKIIVSHQFPLRIPWFIEREINNIARDTRNNFSVLIISPTRTQSLTIAKKLRAYGFSNIESKEKVVDKGPSLLEGLDILIRDKASNLGWRILAKYILKEIDFRDFLLKTNDDNPPKCIDLISNDKQKEVIKLLAIIRAIKNGKIPDNDKLDLIFEKLELSPYIITKDFIKNEFISMSQLPNNPAVRKIKIKSTTIQSSKGLSEDYVFLTYFDDQYLINNKDKKVITDRDICNFLVALTRARKKVYVIPSRVGDPTFLNWINKERINIIN